MVSCTSFWPSAFDQPGRVISESSCVPRSPEHLVVVGQIDRLMHRRLERRVRLRPGRPVARLAHRLLRVRVHPVPGDRSGPDERLGQEVSEGPVGHLAGGQEGLGELGPAVRHLGEHGQPGAYVLAALGVMRGQRGHRLRLPMLPVGLQRVELGQRDTELPGVAAHLVQRDEPGVAVVRGVLHALGHGRATELLHPHRELVVMIMESRTQGGEGPGQVRPPGRRRPQRMVQVLDAFGQVGPIHLEGHGHLTEGLRGVRHLGHERGHPPPLCRQQGADHQPLALLDVLGDGTVITGEPRIELGHCAFVIAVEKDPVHLAHRVVARRSRHGPTGW